MITERQAIARAELLNTLAEQERETGGCVQSGDINYGFCI